MKVPALPTLILAIFVILLIGMGMLGSIQGSIPAFLLWAIKLSGGALSIGAGVLALFTHKTVARNRLTPFGWGMAVVIAGGGGLALTSDWIKARDDDQQSTTLITDSRNTLDQVEKTLLAVDRQVYPFKDVAFSIYLSVNLNHPAFKALKESLQHSVADHRSSLDKLSRESSVDFDNGKEKLQHSVADHRSILDEMSRESTVDLNHGFAWLKDDRGRMALVVYGTAPVMPKLNAGDPAAELLFDPHIQIDIYKKIKPDVGTLTSKASSGKVLRSDDFSYSLDSVGQDVIGMMRAGHPQDVDEEHRLLYYPDTGECLLSLFGNKPALASSVTSFSGSIVGIVDLAQTRFVLQLSTTNDPGIIQPLTLNKLDMFVDNREWDIGVEKFYSASTEKNGLLYVLDAPTVDKLVASFRLRPS